MTRSEYRRTEHMKTPTYNYTEQQIPKHWSCRIQESKDEATKSYICPLLCIYKHCTTNTDFGKNKIQ